MINWVCETRCNMIIMTGGLIIKARIPLELRVYSDKCRYTPGYAGRLSHNYCFIFYTDSWRVIMNYCILLVNWFTADSHILFRGWSTSVAYKVSFTIITNIISLTIGHY